MSADCPQGSAGILDKYAATATTVTDGERIIGLLYGGCATAAVNNNAIFGRWLQARHSPTEMGPNDDLYNDIYVQISLVCQFLLPDI